MKPKWNLRNESELYHFNDTFHFHFFSLFNICNDYNGKHFGIMRFTKNFFLSFLLFFNFAHFFLFLSQKMIKMNQKLDVDVTNSFEGPVMLFVSFFFLVYFISFLCTRNFICYLFCTYRFVILGRISLQLSSLLLFDIFENFFQINVHIRIINALSFSNFIVFFSSLAHAYYYWANST